MSLKATSSAHIVPIRATHFETTVPRRCAIAWIAITDDVLEGETAIPVAVSFLLVVLHVIGSREVVPGAQQLHHRSAMDRGSAEVRVGCCWPLVGNTHNRNVIRVSLVMMMNNRNSIDANVEVRGARSKCEDQGMRNKSKAPKF